MCLSIISIYPGLGKNLSSESNYILKKVCKSLPRHFTRTCKHICVGRTPRQSHHFTDFAIPGCQGEQSRREDLQVPPHSPELPLVPSPNPASPQTLLSRLLEQSFNQVWDVIALQGVIFCYSCEQRTISFLLCNRVGSRRGLVIALCVVEQFFLASFHWQAASNCLLCFNFNFGNILFFHLRLLHLISTMSFLQNTEHPVWSQQCNFFAINCFDNFD